MENFHEKRSVEKYTIPASTVFGQPEATNTLVRDSLRPFERERNVGGKIMQVEITVGNKEKNKERLAMYEQKMKEMKKRKGNK